MPVEQGIEEQEEECNEAERLNGLRERIARVAEILCGEDNRDEPEVREDEVEQQDEAGKSSEEERNQKESDSEDGDDFKIDNVIAGSCTMVQRDPVGNNAHNNHRRNPDQQIAEEENGVQPNTSTGGRHLCGIVW